MLPRKPQHKQFEYIPRYYDPSKDQRERQQRRIKFERNTSRGSHRPLYIVVIMFVLAYLIYTMLK